MTEIPDYIDNSKESLETTLRNLIDNHNQKVLDIATGYFGIESLLLLETSLRTLSHFRLLIGRDPSIKPSENHRIDLLKYFRSEIANQLEEKPLNSRYKNEIDRLIDFCQQENVEIRLFGSLGEKSQFFHAKAYIFYKYSIVGSSNFTRSGLNNNTELNIVNTNQAITHHLRHNWFNKFWDDPSVDINYKEKLIDTLNASKFGSKPYTPYQIFIKVLHELFKDEYNIKDGESSSVELASFQEEGFIKAIRLINKHRGCIIADAVGLGKTYIGLKLIEYYLKQERKPRHIPRALVICPAQLKHLVWVKKLDEFGLKSDVISHEEISRKEFDLRPYSKYDIIVVDESHNFRNSSTNRYQNLQRLLSSGQQRLVLLTATPINNSIYDLYHQILLITRGDQTHYRLSEIPNLEKHFQELYKGISNKGSTDLLLETMVRRSRQDIIKRQEAGEEIMINGEIIHFPLRELEKFTYNFEANFKGLYDQIADKIDGLNLAPYNIKSFKKSKEKTDETEVKRNNALVALQKSLYLKRFESALIAFEKSIRNQRAFQVKFLEILTNEKKLLDSQKFRKLILASEDETENKKLEDIINELEEIDPNDYKVEQLQSGIKNDINALDHILNMVTKILSQDHNNGDEKLASCKQLLTQLKGKKILIFTYFKETANYLYKELRGDEKWLSAMEISGSKIDLITGETSGKERQTKVKRFAPKANQQGDEDLTKIAKNALDILICTDVLSEGQNLQDASVLINYDLHWNPVRMIQRAGRIDRLGTEYDTLYIYNCFPEQGLEKLLGLVKSLQKKIAEIDREVGLDSSVLGEEISERSLDQLERLKNADTAAEKAAILAELEEASDLTSLDEMRLPLLEFMQNKMLEEIEYIPNGVYSTYHFNIPDVNFREGGLFIALKARDQDFWFLYPRIQGHISHKEDLTIRDKAKIFRCLRCQAAEFPKPEDLPPAIFNNHIFFSLERAIDQVSNIIEQQIAASKNTQKLSKNAEKIVTKIKKDTELDASIKERVLKVFDLIPLKNFDRDLKAIWLENSKGKSEDLLKAIDNFFTENGQHDQIVASIPTPIEKIKKEEIKLICYEWFYPH